MTLELDNVELYFKSKPILNSIYLKASSGEITHVLGRNGSGKSSLLKIIFGDLNPKYKLLRINGNVVSKPLYVSGTIKLLPEHSFIPNNLSLKRAFKEFNVSWDSFKELFPDFMISADQKFRFLSGGEKRIVEAYLVLKTEGEIVLLDEPFKSLSPITIERLKTVIVSQKREKLIIGADHHFDHWEDIADIKYHLKNRALYPLA